MTSDGLAHGRVSRHLGVSAALVLMWAWGCSSAPPGGTAGTTASPAPSASPAGACAPSGANTWGPPVAVSSGLTRTMGGSFLFPPCGSRMNAQSFVPRLGLRDETLDAQAIQLLADAQGAPSGPDAYLPVLPLFSLESTPAFVAPPKIVHLSGGVASDFYVFTDDPTRYTTDFFQQNVTVGTQSGAVARGLQMSAAAAADGTLYVSNSVTGEITKFDATGAPSTYASGLAGVMNLALRPDGTLLAALPARFQSDVLEAPPRIIGIAPGQTPQTVYSFPADGLDYGTGFFRTVGAETLPVGFLVEMALGADGSLYATLNTTGVLYQIDPTGRGTQIEDGLPTPIGVAVASDGTVFLAFAPELAMGGPDAGAGTGIRVVALGADGTQTPVYQGPLRDAYATGFYRATGGPGPAAATSRSSGAAQGDTAGGAAWEAQPMDAVAHLTVDARGDLYLQDSLANELLALPRE